MASTSKLLPVLIGAGGLFFGALFIFIGLYLRREGRELRKDGVTITATVLKRYRSDVGSTLGGLENHWISAAFVDDARASWKTEVKVSSKLSRSLKEGGTVPLTWIPGDLASVRPGMHFGWKLRGTIGTGMIAVGALAALLFPIAAIREALR